MPRTFECPACRQPVTTSAAPGQTARCKRCGEEARVPLRDVAHARREVTCAACGETQETATPPGKRTRCRACGGEVRVPLRDLAEAPPPAPAPGGGGRRRVSAGQTCPYCRTRGDPGDVACPGCGEPFAALAEAVPGGRIGGALLLLIGGFGALAALHEGSISMTAVMSGLAAAGALGLSRR